MGRLMSWTRISKRADTADTPNPVSARAKALELLARREHSRLELRQKLIQRGFPSDHIEPVLDQLMEERLLDEARFAEIYACSRADKGYGPLRIGRELRERGVAQALVDTVLADLGSDWLPKLQALHRKRFKALLPTNAMERMQQTRVLRQHGFSLDQIKQFFDRDAE